MEINYRVDLPVLMAYNNLPMVAAMVGVAEGYDSADLLRNGIEKLYMVDLWETHTERFGDVGNPQEWHDKNYGAAMTRVEKYQDKVIILKGFSDKMAAEIPDESLGLAYIDCGHDYTSVCADIAAYWPKLVPGGIMAFHDYLNEAYGVYDAVHNFARDKYTIHLIPENATQDAGAWIRKD